MTGFLAYREALAGTAKDIASGLSIMAFLIGVGMYLSGVFA